MAKEQDKPIFLSIGYSTCHWCHVMEQESFEDRTIATRLNDTFVNIKMDREELPEVDSLYMEFAQSMMAGVSGWPLNVILTPDLKPFLRGNLSASPYSHGLIRVYRTDHTHQRCLGQRRAGTAHRSRQKQIVEVFAENVHVKGSDLPERDLLEDAASFFFRCLIPFMEG